MEDSDDEEEEIFLKSKEDFQITFLEKRLNEYGVSRELFETICSRSRGLKLHLINITILVASFVTLNRSGFKIEKDSFVKHCDRAIEEIVKRDIEVRDVRAVRKDILRYCRHIVEFT